MKLTDYSMTKEKIFVAACKLFSKKCYADVGIREIAIEAGVKVPTVYNHYASKEAILENLFQFYVDRITGFYEAAADFDFDQDPFECFRKIIFTFDVTETELMRQLMRIIFNEQHRSPLAAKIIYDILLREGKKNNFIFLSHLKNRGVIPCDMNQIDCFAEIISRVAVTFAMQYVRDDEVNRRPDYENVMMTLLKTLLNSSLPQDQDQYEDQYQDEEKVPVHERIFREIQDSLQYL